MKRMVSIAGLLLVVLLAAACGSSTATSAPAHSTVAMPVTWVDEPVTFVAGGITIYATFRHPADSSGAFAAVLLIAGSGPTDRNGNSKLAPGPIDTLKTLADWLSSDGVASLRYDKLGSGQTGLGPYSLNLAGIGIGPFQQESLAALDFLAKQNGVNDKRIGVFGHSEGALFALLLATGNDGTVPPIHAVGLLEPLSVRYLDLLTNQVDGQINNELTAGYFTESRAAQVKGALAAAISQLRAHGPTPLNLPAGLSGVFNASTELFLYQADKYDPAALAAQLSPGMPVLVTCSNADQQVSCAEVDHLIMGLTKANAHTDFVKLIGVDHVLKVDPSGAATDYTKPLPFSSQLKSALSKFVQLNLK